MREEKLNDILAGFGEYPKKYRLVLCPSAEHSRLSLFPGSPIDRLIMPTFRSIVCGQEVHLETASPAAGEPGCLQQPAQ